MLQRHLATTMLVGAVTGSASPCHANTAIWESWPAIFTPVPYTQPYQQPRREFAPSRQGSFQPQMQLAAYHPPSTQYNGSHNDPIQRGLLSLAQVLERKSPWEPTPLMGNSITHGMLAETVQKLLHWNSPLLPEALQSSFDLLPIDSAKGSGQGNFTGYFTPELNGSRIRTERFRIPVYGKPPRELANLSHADIANGALAGRGLEIAWIDNPFELYIAHVQGAALIHFQDGSQSMVDYAASNNHSFSSVGDYLHKSGHKTGSLSNAEVDKWLHEHPEKMHEALTSNQRYIFFKETGEIPTTASGNGVIPGHTIAVDSHHIPHGSVLLAELPRFDAAGNIIGSEWRLLFAQDRGKNIQGSGRMDLYLGIGKAAESMAYKISGAHRTYLLIRKSG